MVILLLCGHIFGTGRLMKNITRIFLLDKKSGAIQGLKLNVNFPNGKTLDNVFLLVEKGFNNFILFLCLVYCLLFLISHTISLPLILSKIPVFDYNLTFVVPSLLPS